MNLNEPEHPFGEGIDPKGKEKMNAATNASTQKRGRGRALLPGKNPSVDRTGKNLRYKGPKSRKRRLARRKGR